MRYIKLLALAVLTAFFCACSGQKGVYATNKNIYLNNSYIDGKDKISLEFDQNSTILPPVSQAFWLDSTNFLNRWFKVYTLNSPKFQKELFWGLNIKNTPQNSYYFDEFTRVSDEWFLDVKNNANVAGYGKVARFGVTTQNSLIKNLPTNLAIFKDFKKLGYGVPFDVLSNSAISIGSPVFVSHFSLDDKFAFVQNDSVWGWIEKANLKLLDNDEVYGLESSKFATILVDKTPVYGDNDELIFIGRVGAILPVNSQNEQFFSGVINTPTGMKRYKIYKPFATSWPAWFDTKNVKTMINSLLLEPYGWGGYRYNRDCSLLIKDFLAAFGIWLPRNSKSQANMGEVVQLSNLSNKEKEEMIKSRGVPYLTLLYMPGHIMLYTGVVDGEITMFHDVWGLKTDSDGRALIGGAVITTPKIGSYRDDISVQNLLISKITSMTILSTQNSDLNSSLSALFEPYELKNGLKFASANSALADALNPPQSAIFEDKKATSIAKTYPVIIKDGVILFENGTKMKFGDCATALGDIDKLDNPSVCDMLYMPYIALENSAKVDAGRVRNEQFFSNIYGLSKDEVEKNLVDVSWLGGEKVFKFNSKNGAANALKKVSKELEELIKTEPKMALFVNKPSGTFNYRFIAGTPHLSAHSWGIAIDINVENSNYWRWEKSGEYKNKIPMKIVEIFEKHHFIWGGRWEKFDTMHFEYRPEFFVK